jgi:hypothetical protein
MSEYADRVVLSCLQDATNLCVPSAVVREVVRDLAATYGERAVREGLVSLLRTEATRVLCDGYACKDCPVYKTCLGEIACKSKV